jgi:hypothetical protein
VGFGSVGERLVSVEDTVEFEAMGYQLLRIDLARSNAIEQHWRADSVGQPRGDGAVTIPQVVCTENLSSGVVVVKSAQDGA